MRLDGKHAIITGGGSGIGAAAARLFTAEGATVVVLDRDAGAADTVAGELDGAIAIGGSVDDPATYEAAIASVPRVDVAYLNAGVYGHTGPIEDLPLDVYRATIGANIDGVVLGVRALVPAMRAAGGGAIVVTASQAGIVAFAGNPVYTLTKHAVAGFVRALAPSLAAHDITIDAVCPGVVDTPMTVEATGGAPLGELPLIDPTFVAAQALDLAITEGSGRCRAIRERGEPVDWVFPDFRDVARA